MSKEIVTVPKPPAPTIYETDRLKIFADLITTLEKRKEEYKTFAVKDITEAIQLQALLNYYDIPLTAKRIGCTPKVLYDLQKIDYSSFFDNLFKERQDKIIFNTFDAEELADAGIIKGLKDGVLNAQPTNMTQYINASKMFSEKRMRYLEIKDKREQPANTLNVNVGVIMFPQKKYESDNRESTLEATAETSGSISEE